MKRSAARLARLEVSAAVTVSGVWHALERQPRRYRRLRIAEKRLRLRVADRELRAPSANPGTTRNTIAAG